MMFPAPVGERVNWISDHTPVDFCVEHLSEHNELQSTIRLMTFNLLNQCLPWREGEQGQIAANNPWNLRETDECFYQRFSWELNFICACIEKGKGKDKPLDVICLQEVSELIFTRRSDRSNPLIQQFRKIKESFEKRIETLDWKIVKTTSKDNCRPLATLYNGKRWECLSQRGVLSIGGERNPGFEILLKDRMTQQLYAATNVHLIWSMDYRKTIIDYQIRQIANDTFTTIAGDTNHPPTYKQASFVGNGRFATNIDVDSQGAMSVYESRGKKLPKRYDGAGASPAGGHRIRIKEGEGKYFTPSCEVMDFNPETDYPEMMTHTSEAGKPWIEKKFLPALDPFFANFNVAAHEETLAKVIKDKIKADGCGLVEGGVSIGEDGDNIWVRALEESELPILENWLKSMQMDFERKIGGGARLLLCIHRFDAIPLMEMVQG